MRPSSCSTISEHKAEARNLKGNGGNDQGQYLLSDEYDPRGETDLVLRPVLLNHAVQTGIILLTGPKLRIIFMARRKELGVLGRVRHRGSADAVDSRGGLEGVQPAVFSLKPEAEDDREERGNAHRYEDGNPR